MRKMVKNNYYFISFTIHFFLLIFLFIGGEVGFFSFSNDHIVEIKSAVRVDMVGLPDKTLKELKSRKIKKNSKKSTKVASKEIKQDTSDSSLAKVIAEAKKKKISSTDEKNFKKNLNKEDKKDHLDKIESLVVKGNQLSAGRDMDSNRLAEERDILEEYAENISLKVRTFWQLPVNFKKDDKLVCRLKVFISSKGQLLRVDFYQKSSNEEFNQRALQSIKLAAPFDPPPESVAKIVENGTIILGFPI